MKKKKIYLYEHDPTKPLCYYLVEAGRLKKAVEKIIDKVHHVNPNCKDATKCEPHGEVGEVINGN
jgi:hypothetical protein